MRMMLLAVLCWLCAFPLRADESNLLLVVDGVTYSNVTFKTVTPVTVTIIHQTGVATIPLEKLPVELQKRFNYDPQRAGVYGLTLTPSTARPLMPDAEVSAYLSAVSEDVSNGPNSYVSGSLFAAYDRKVVATVKKHWYELIDHYGISGGLGMVTVRFQLFGDGHVANVTSLDGTTSRILSLFCEKAVIESGPFDPLPSELLARVGKAPRNVSFTFHY